MYFLRFQSKKLVPVFVILCFSLLLAACSPPANVAAPQEEMNVPVTSAFPVTIEHKYGSTIIESLPQRVVSVGLTEQDALLALGVVPLATREWYGQRPGAIFPWAEEKLGDAALPQVLEFELDFEKIALLQPDLIVGLYSALTQEEYDTLSQIAPTVAQPGEYIDWGIPWQQQTLVIGRALGQESRAEELIAAVDARFAAARDEHPEFTGASAVIASTYGFPESYYVYSAQDVRGRFLTSLGFSIPEEVNEIAGSEFGATISRERLNVVDLDVLIWITDTPAEMEILRNDPLYQQLAVFSEGRDLFYDAGNPLYDALNFSTVLSLSYAIDGIVPDLAAVIER